ncbi:MAG: zinc dependent phospholipase C family protein [Clostridia bacterium]|nr:zinc dependent phospholipase C family protein [Clostridia bacterium]
MPNWKTHIEFGKRVNKKLNYTGEKLELFLIGNLLPDINNGYMIPDISKKIDHETTHYVINGNYSYINFYNKHKENIKKNPLLMGYFAHLFLDYNMNNDFYTTYREDNINKYEHKQLRMMKQSDFRLYNNKYLDNYIEISDVDNLVIKLEELCDVYVKREEIIKIVDFLKRKIGYEAEYFFYTEAELNNLFESIIGKFSEFVDEYNLI